MTSHEVQCVLAHFWPTRGPPQERNHDEDRYGRYAQQTQTQS
jgi:hypothetical protein